MDLPKVAFVVSVSTAKYPRERIIIEGDEDKYSVGVRSKGDEVVYG